MPLSEFKISKAKPKEKPYKLSDGGGLFLLVNPEVSLARARGKLNEARSMLADGQDPAIEKKLAQINAETQARTTFKLIAEEYIVNMEERGLAPATMKKKCWLLLDLASPLHTRPINDITSAELLYLLKSIEKSGRRETAKKCVAQFPQYSVWRLLHCALKQIRPMPLKMHSFPQR